MGLDFLKYLDLFSEPVHLRINRRNTKEVKYGTYTGMLISILIIMGLLGYTIVLMLDMSKGTGDIHTKNVMINNFEEPYNLFNMSKYNFMPTIAFSMLKKGPEVLEEFAKDDDMDIFVEGYENEYLIDY